MGFNKQIRINISISERHVNIDEFEKKMRKVLSHLDYRKGKITGTLNLSRTFIYLIESKYEELFGNKNPSDVKELPYELVNLNFLREDSKRKFYDHLKDFGNKGMLYNRMNEYMLNVFSGLEKEFRRRTHD